MNPRLGIVDGLSILGTTGLVEPMSEQALTRTIELEMNMRKEDGATVLCLVPGNYGSEFLEEKLGIRRSMRSNVAIMWVMPLIWRLYWAFRRCF